MTLSEFGVWVGVCGGLIGIGTILMRTGRMVQRIEDLCDKMAVLFVKHDNTERVVSSLSERVRVIEVTCGERHGKLSGDRAHG